MGSESLKGSQAVLQWVRKVINDTPLFKNFGPKRVGNHFVVRMFGLGICIDWMWRRSEWECLRTIQQLFCSSKVCTTGAATTTTAAVHHHTLVNTEDEGKHCISPPPPCLSNSIHSLLLLESWVMQIPLFQSLKREGFVFEVQRHDRWFIPKWQRFIRWKPRVCNSTWHFRDMWSVNFPTLIRRI